MGSIFSIDDVDVDALLSELTSTGFLHVAEVDEDFVSAGNAVELTRDVYEQMFGPTTGDLVALGDTCLLARVEKDLCTEVGYGDEVKFGGGKVVRDGMGQKSTAYNPESYVICLPQKDLRTVFGLFLVDVQVPSSLNVFVCVCLLLCSSPDLVLTGALVIDWTGIYKADIGVKGGMISAIGKAGNSDVMDGVHPKLELTACTEVISCEGMIVTAGGIDTHVHFICPQLIDEALASGITTLYGGGTGPATGEEDGE